MMLMPRPRLALAALVCCLSACTAVETSPQLLSRAPANMPEASLRTVAPLLSSAEVQAYANDLKTVAPLQPGPALESSELGGDPVPRSLGGTTNSAPTFRVVTRSVGSATPEQLQELGLQLAALTFKVPLLTRFGVQSTPDGSTIEHVTMVATEAPGTRLMVVEWEAKEVRLWQVEPVEYGGIGPGLASGLEASLSVAPVLEAWKRERSRLDRKPLAFRSEGVIPKFEFVPTFDKGPSFPGFPWPRSVVQPQSSGESQRATMASPALTRTVAGLAGHGFRVDWFARPDRSPLAVVQTLENDPGAREEVVFDAVTLEVLGVHLPGQNPLPDANVVPPQGEAAPAGS